MRKTAGMRGNDEAVVLVHGLWLGSWSMRLIAKQLRHQGFRPYSFGYPTVCQSLRENAAALRAFSESLGADTVHFVGHSLGGIVIRAMLTYCAPSSRGRVVTLGSPHRGSAVADQLGRYRLGKRILGYSIADLCTGELPCEFSGREIGVIKGNRSIGLGRMLFRLPEPNDGVVSLAEAELPGATDTLTLSVAHSGMLLSSDVSRQVGEFLRHGRFRH